MNRSDKILRSLVYSPVDNLEGYDTHLPMMSRLVGGHVRSVFQYKNILGTLTSLPGTPWAGWAHNALETAFTRPIRTHAQVAAMQGDNPDTFVYSDELLERLYASMLHDLTGEFIDKTGHFSQQKAQEVMVTSTLRRPFTQRVENFRYIELAYGSYGLSPLKALRELLTTLVMAVTEERIAGPLPYAESDTLDFETYLSAARKRLENLFSQNAFYIKDFSERVTGGIMGVTPYGVVPGSRLGPCSLRRYTLAGRQAHPDKVLYLASPLINKPDIFDLAKGKSVVEALAERGYLIYLNDPGEPGEKADELDLDFYGKTVHDHNIALIQKENPGRKICVMGYCMGGTLLLPWLGRRAEEKEANGEAMDIVKIALMASPVRFDDALSGQGPMRQVVRNDYDPALIAEMYQGVGVPPQIIDAGMNDIQPGVRYFVRRGFYQRAGKAEEILEAAPFFYWLTHGTRFGTRSHLTWIGDLFMGSGLEKGTYALPSSVPALDGKPVSMTALSRMGVALFDYRGKRDPISPPGACVASELWGTEERRTETRGGLNRTIEKNAGHIFVVSRRLLSEFIESVDAFFHGG
ncbi:hypothetical protein [Desulfoluna sp.]|uniref:hypothetical protein n=1 Tax=Desulfoluna sp. TaxID=2045199 RepID=UPI002602335C|nr:hypothetical protein [Desulfoluna sp.]